MHKLFLLPFVVAIAASSAQTAEPPFKPDYSQTCNYAITSGAQTALDKRSNEIQESFLRSSDPGSDRIVRDLVKAGREYYFTKEISEKYLELMSYAEKKYKCALRLIQPIYFSR
jgi:hypothetical protein